MSSASSDPKDFVMGFVAASERYKRQFEDRWEEVLASFMVEPRWANEQRDTSPYRTGSLMRGRKKRVILKDPQTNRIVNTYVAKLVRALFSDPHHEYIQAEPVGYEDVQKAETTTKLLRYAMSLPGTFRTWVESLTDTVIFGTGIIEVSWYYCEREMPVRQITSTLGIETESTQRMMIPVYDDVMLKPVDVMDFYPDPSRYRLQEMAGAAKKFRMNTFEAHKLAKYGLYNKEAVERAFAGSGSMSPEEEERSIRQGLDQPAESKAPEEFRDRIGYEYWGDVPWETDGSVRRVITVLNGEKVRDVAYPLNDPALPFHSLIINPLQGRFYGVAPAEVIRYDQSFADAVKMLLAQAVIRNVLPPIAYDPSAVDDPEALKEWKPEALIAATGGPNSVGVVKYNADFYNGFQMLAGLQTSMLQASGAEGGGMGEAGPDREAATVGAKRLEYAVERPELAAMVIENDGLPQIGLALLRRYQQFLQGTDDLKLRVGELPESGWIGDIMGDFDVRFSGSRQAMTRQAKLQNIDRIIAYASAVPAFQIALPNIEIAQWMIGQLMELPEIAAKIGDPQAMLVNLLAMQAGGGGGPAQNGVGPASEAPGMLPAQSAGGVP